MLSITDLSFSFGTQKIFEHLNLSFESGGITGIVGKNGVGKTTLFRILSNIYGIQSGNIHLNSKKLVPSDIVFMTTEPYFYPYMKGQEYIKIVANDPSEMELATHYASILDIPLHELVDNYSTGMRKKLAFSALFALKKPIIILDEPYNGVDLESNEIIKQIIKTQSANKIVLLSSHILSTITDVCDSVYHITENQCVTQYFDFQYDQLQATLNTSMQDKLKNLNPSNN
jgi:ABC-2 type transport system ATP-binding protein